MKSLKARFSRWTLPLSTAATFGLVHVAHAQIGGATGSAPASFFAFIQNAVSVLRSIVLLIALLVFIVAGFMLLISGGDDTKKDSAKNMIIYAIVGIVIIFVAQILIDIAGAFVT